MLQSECSTKITWDPGKTGRERRGITSPKSSFTVLCQRQPVPFAYHPKYLSLMQLSVSFGNELLGPTSQTGSSLLPKAPNGISPSGPAVQRSQALPSQVFSDGAVAAAPIVTNSKALESPETAAVTLAVPRKVMSKRKRNFVLRGPMRLYRRAFPLLSS